MMSDQSENSEMGMAQFETVLEPDEAEGLRTWGCFGGELAGDGRTFLSWCEG